MKTCPQCGAQQEESAKFCTNCGFNFAQAAQQPAEPTPVQAQPEQAQPEQAQPQQPTPQPTPAPQPAQPQSDSLANAKQAGLNYWSWLIASVKRPTASDLTGGRYYGLVSLLLIAFFTTVSIVKPMFSAANTVSSAANIFGENVSSAVSSTANSAVWGAGFRLFILLACVDFVLFLGAFLGRRAITGQPSDFWGLLTRYQQRVGISVFLSFAAAVLGLFAGAATITVIALIISLNFVFQTVAFYQVALGTPQKGGMDPVYTLVLINVGMTIVNLLIITVFGSSLVDMVQHLF
ncbi:zinc ribbon domain-containing protein [Lacticaseibacillus parakribbianus]|uniref:zinc ribbon domain-containing protein n=1 Tax=Lacticaseibacillus parakribbianus TaxID=2970927 RepID=UPI0021CB6910|nr:zinc ribbon domain-containing protein [Lacticaseibacillus parakribbianus]